MSPVRALFRCSGRYDSLPARGLQNGSACLGSSMKIQDARAVVTGGASGLGAAVGSYIASKGGKVILVDVQEGPGQAAAAKSGANASFLRCDVTSEAEVNSTMETAASRMGGLNLLVNCAGVIGAGRVLGKK